MVDHVFGFCWIQIYRLLSRTKDIFVTIGMNRFQTKFFAHPGFRSWVGVNLKLSTTELSSINVNWFSIKILFSDQVSGCDFEFSSVLRRWWWVGGRDGIRMEKTWRGSGPFNKSPFIELLQLLQIYIIVVVCFHLFWHSEVLNWISYKLLTNFELAPISISFAPLFQFYYLPSLIFCWQKTLCYVLKRVFLLFVF